MPSASYAIAKHDLIKKECFIIEVVRSENKRNYSHYENNFNKMGDRQSSLNTFVLQTYLKINT